MFYTTGSSIYSCYINLSFYEQPNIRPNKNIPGFSSKDFVNVNVAYCFFIFLFSAALEAQQMSHFGSAPGKEQQFTFLSIHFLYLKNLKNVTVMWQLLYFEMQAMMRNQEFFFYLAEGQQKLMTCLQLVIRENFHHLLFLQKHYIKLQIIDIRILYNLCYFQSIKPFFPNNSILPVRHNDK